MGVVVYPQLEFGQKSSCPGNGCGPTTQPLVRKNQNHQKPFFLQYFAKWSSWSLYVLGIIMSEASERDVIDICQKHHLSLKSQHMLSY